MKMAIIEKPLKDALSKVRARHYPETAAGGYSRVDGTMEFFTRVHSLLTPDAKVMDLGAGRGSELVDDPVPVRRRLRDLRAPGRHVLGLDVDPVVLENVHVDAAAVISPDSPLPVESASIDLVLSDYVFEHVEDPRAFVAEIERVLKPGGWLCARTPNLFSYVGIGVNLTPNRMHAHLLGSLQPDRKSIDVFPTRYRMNSFRALRRAFPPDQWRHAIYSIDSEPVYVGGNSIAWSLVRLLQRLSPRTCRTNLFVFLQKI